MNDVSPDEFEAHFSHIAFGKVGSLGGEIYGAEMEVFPCKRCGVLVAWTYRSNHVEWHINLEGEATWKGSANMKQGDYCKNCGGDGYVDFTNPSDRMVDVKACPACGGSGKDGKTLDRLKSATRKRDDTVEEA